MWRPLYEPLLAFGVWVASGRCLIQDRITRATIPLVMTPAQQVLYETMLDMAYEGLPIRIIVPKSRRQGISTFAQAAQEFLCSLLKNRKAMTYAQSKDDTRAIFELAHFIRRAELERYGEEDSEAVRMGIRWPHGSAYECRTARSTSVSRGSTVDFMHLSEWGSILTAAGLDSDAAEALLNTVGDSPASIIIMESTGVGPFGDFYERCKAAMQGKGDFRLCFFPWYMDLRNTRPAPKDFQATDDEIAMQMAFTLTKDQLFWYRKKFETSCGDGKDAARVARFKREWPSVVEDCFGVSGGRVWPHFSELTHKHEIAIPLGASPWKLYRSIDWGDSYNHPFCCLWIAHQPDLPPGFSVSATCPETIRECLAYRRNEKTGVPMHVDDHAPSAIRYFIAEILPKGHVHVYREYYDRSPPPWPEVARKLHDLSGWQLPAGVHELDLNKMRPGPNGERYEMTVADRARSDSIKGFSTWGMGPITGYRKIIGSTNMGEIEDQIFIVASLMSGQAYMAPIFEDQERKTANSAMAKLRGGAYHGRQVCLTEEEEKVVAKMNGVAIRDRETVNPCLM